MNITPPIERGLIITSQAARMLRYICRSQGTLMSGLELPGLWNNNNDENATGGVDDGYPGPGPE